MADASDPQPNDTNDNQPKNNSNNLGAACFRCRGFRHVLLFSQSAILILYSNRHACDRQKPACSRCKRRGITCTYPEAAPTLKKLQKATETLGDRIRKFGDRLKSTEAGMPKEFRAISLQRLAQQQQQPSPPTPDTASDTVSMASSEATCESNSKQHRLASTSNFSVYPCAKCFKDLQQCDLTLPKCSRCEANNFECVYGKTEPKANHVSQVLTTMNKVMDQWQESIDRMARDFAQKTRDFSQRTNNAFRMKPLQPFAWKITSTGRGLSVESNVNSYNDFSKLVDQFKRSMHIGPPVDDDQDKDDGTVGGESPGSMRTAATDERQRIAQSVELDDTSSVHTSSGFSFAVWNSWSHPMHAVPQDYPIDITDELTDNLVELYCRSPCCSAIRLPIIDTTEFMRRYYDPENRPSQVLIYAMCSMSARNAFQLHMWSKRPAHESPQYNMGKALSIAYCLKGREMLSECFDEPSLDNCKAAILLSYCSYQNGYSGVIYIYEWIAYNMARELGLYDSGREFTEAESKLVWCLYYFNTWYRVLQGGSSASVESSQFYPCCPLPEPPVKPNVDAMKEDDEDEDETTRQQLVDYYVWSTWYYLIRLQILRHDVMSRLVAIQTTPGKADPNVSLELLALQDRLQEFYSSLPDEWRSPDIAAMAAASKNSNNSQSSGSPCAAMDGLSPSSAGSSDRHYHVDIRSFARFCILHVHIYYNINKILLYQAFFPSEHFPTVPFSIQCLYTCVDAASTITQTLEYMSQQHDECNVPLIGFLFANIVYIKLLNYHEHERWSDFARQCLQLSVDISKASITYMYDFERAKTLVSVMEQDVRALCGPSPPSPFNNIPIWPHYHPPPHMQRTNSVDSSSDGWSLRSHSSMPSPPYLPVTSSSSSSATAALHQHHPHQYNKQTSITGVPSRYYEMMQP